MPEPIIAVPNYVAFDLETTGLSYENDEILEIAAVKFVNGEVSSRFSTLVKPKKPAPLKALRLTHISSEELEGGVDLTQGLESFQRFRGNLPLVGHNSSFDAQFIAKSISGFPDVPLYDTLELSRIILPGLGSYKLTELAGVLGLNLDEAHRAYADAEVSGVLFRLVQEKCLNMPLWLKELILDMMGKDWVARGIFQSHAKDVHINGFNQPCLIREPWFLVPSTQTTVASDGKTIELEEFLSHLDQVFHDSSQRLLAVGVRGEKEVSEAIAKRMQEYSKEKNVRILGIGFPQIESLGKARLDAQEGYVCLLKVAMLSSLAKKGFLDDLGQDDKRFLASLFSWAEITGDGHISGFQVPRSAFHLWKEVCVSFGEHCLKACPFKEECHYLRARQKANSSAVVFSDPGSPLKGDSFWQGLDDFNLVAVWRLTDMARFFQYEEPWIDLSRLKEALQGTKYSDIIQVFANKCLSYVKARQESVFPNSLLGEVQELLNHLSCAKDDFRSSLRHKGDSPQFFSGGLVLEETGIDLPVLSGKVHEIETQMRGLYGFLKDEEGTVRLIHSVFMHDGSRGVGLSRKALWPGKKALGALLRKSAKVVLFHEHVGFMKKHPGLSAFYGVEEAESRVLSAREPDFGHVLVAILDREEKDEKGKGTDREKEVREISDFICQLAQRVSRLAILFPSQALLKSIYSILCPLLEEKAIAVFGQGIDGGVKVLEELRQENTVVMARLNQNLNEEELSLAQCVVIPKIPFLPPNPLDDIRRKHLTDKGYDGFDEVNLGHARELIYRVGFVLQKTGLQKAMVFMDQRLLPLKSAWGDAFQREIPGNTKILAKKDDLFFEIQRWFEIGADTHQ